MANMYSEHYRPIHYHCTDRFIALGVCPINTLILRCKKENVTSVFNVLGDGRVIVSPLRIPHLYK